MAASDGPPPGGRRPGWVVRSDRADLDLDAVVERYGLVYRHPVDDDERADQMAPGDPCFLLRTDRSRVVGLWAVGEVVGPAEVVPAALVPPRPDGPDAEPGRYVEVEMLPLDKPVALSKLTARPPLADGELARWERHPNPLRLDRAEVRAIEALEFWLREPTDDQRRAFDQLLAAEDAEVGSG